TSQQQANDANVPQGPTVIPEWEIKAVKAMVQPSCQAVVSTEGSDDLVHLRIDVRPCLVRIAKLDSHDRQHRGSVLLVVIGVVCREELSVEDWNIGKCFLQPAGNRREIGWLTTDAHSI